MNNPFLDVINLVTEASKSASEVVAVSKAPKEIRDSLAKYYGKMVENTMTGNKGIVCGYSSDDYLLIIAIQPTVASNYAWHAKSKYNHILSYKHNHKGYAYVNVKFLKLIEQ